MKADQSKETLSAYMWSQDLYLPKENVDFYIAHFTVQYQTSLNIKNVIRNKNEKNVLICSSFKQ